MELNYVKLKLIEIWAQNFCSVRNLGELLSYFIPSVTLFIYKYYTLKLSESTFIRVDSEKKNSVY